MCENRVTAEILPSWWLGNGRFSAGLGLGLGAGTGIERIDGSGQIQWSGLAFASPTALVEVGLGHRFALRASAELPLTLLRRDNRVTAIALGGAWLGLSRGFLVGEHIDGFYNPFGRHSALKYHSPIEFEVIHSVEKATERAA
jgi:hypothetical protein